PVRPIITIDGRHHFNQEFFDNVRVPVEDRVGEEGQGWAIAKYLLGHERSNGSGVSMIKWRATKLREMASKERADGERLENEPAFRRKIAELESDLRALELTSLRVLASASADKPIGPEASVLKFRMACMQQAVTELMMEAGAYYAHPLDREALRGQSNAEQVDPDYQFRMAPEYFHMTGTWIAGGSNEVRCGARAMRSRSAPVISSGWRPSTSRCGAVRSAAARTRSRRTSSRSGCWVCDGDLSLVVVSSRAEGRSPAEGARPLCEGPQGGSPAARLSATSPAR